MRCHGCGTCCRKGGPLLHDADIPLVLQGYLPLTALVTLRRGELAHDPVVGRVLPLDTDVVKLAGTGAAHAPWQCVLHSTDGTNACTIYAHRPVQCRVLFCEDTRSIAALYDKNRADRWRILRALRDPYHHPAARDDAPHAPHHALNTSVPVPPVLPDGLLELAQAHAAQCPLPPLAALCDSIVHACAIHASANGDSAPTVDDTPQTHAPHADAATTDAAATLLEAVRFDLAFRELAVERGHIDPALLPFALGRPLRALLRSHGLDVAHAGGDPNAPLTLRRARAMV